MSGISTDKKFAILNTERGMNLDTFKSATELAEQAMRSAMWEMSPEEHAAWAERMVTMVREHRDLPPIDAEAELAELREANRMTPDHLALAKFYGVTTYAALAQAQAYHIEKLQAKLPPTASLTPQRVREG